MALSLDFWRTVQRLRVDTTRRERAAARSAQPAPRRRRPTPRGSWQLMALYALAFAAPVMTAHAVSPQALRRNARLLADALGLLTP